ncbi:MAG: MBL fold metallo-hydrolase [Phycisphaerales bacterium]
MPRGDGKSHSKLTVTSRLRLIGEGLRSSMERYPRDIRRSLSSRRHGSRVATPQDFADRWKATGDPDGPNALTWLGHNTVLMKYAGMTILTDPVLSHRIGVRLPGLTIGPERLLPMVLTPKDLPRADLVLISHAHFDHLDRPTLKALIDRRTSIVTARNTRGLIPRGFGHIHELDWEKSLNINGLEITSIRPNHWGARTAWDRHRGFNSYILGPATSRVLYAGDTAYTTNFDALGPLELGIFGIGAYDPWIHAHASPEQVWKMAIAAQVHRLLPVHHSTFKLSNEPMDEPLSRLLAAAGQGRSRVLDARVGEIVHLKS